ncbi:hypothetical protein IC762_07110 [Bradyrhizobium genosp. L]|uniref:hypothetical protein n=1 Tax=Bradyrhizobium genosp. L TaxID=83637 RepID=UPI0018A2E873|nr:hypothetical protein [Bradyrhizobium genosp. L]QPF86063.1 hypothetical protein IC762_07110 [Bradyrhizobium genosp. L]
MTNNLDNRKRAFADVVTIDAWHEAFSDSNSKVDLHADIVFGRARVGGEPESPVRFRLSIKRAEVVVIIPESEPVAVDRASVSRDSPNLQARLTETKEQSAQASIKGGATGSISATGFTGSATVETGAQANVVATRKIEVSSTVSLLLVTQSQTVDGHYRWTVESQLAKVLEGRAWDANKEPRLKLIDQRKDRSKGIPPSVRVEVRCRREDLVIEDLGIKDQSLWESAKSKFGFKNKLIAAEAYIRDRLMEEGLEVKNIDDIFAHLTLGSVTAGTI